jgi:hypothetical protein
MDIHPGDIQWIFVYIKNGICLQEKTSLAPFLHQGGRKTCTK